MAKKAVTMKDIAQALHVSTGLVSYVLNGRGDEMRISPGMQRQVLEKAREMNYRANLYAKRVRQGQGYQLALSLFWPYQANAGLLNAIFAGIRNVQRMGAADFDLTLQLYDKNMLEQHKRYLQGNRANGAVILCTAQTDWDYIDAHRFSMPVVLLNHPSRTHHCAYIDFQKQMEQVTWAVCQAGYGTIGVCYGEAVVNLRLQAAYLRQACGAAGVNILSASFADYPANEYGGIEAMKRMLAEYGRPPELLIAFSVRMARGASFALMQAGYAVNRDTQFLVLTNQLQRNDPTIADYSLIQYPIDAMASWCITKLLSAENEREAAAQEFFPEWFLRDSFFTARR